MGALALACQSSPSRDLRVRLASPAAAPGRELVVGHVPLARADLAMLRRLASDPHPVDPSHGVDLVVAGGGAADAPDRSSRKVCGADADDEVKRRLDAYLEQAELAAEDGNDSVLTCHELTCAKAPTMEWDPAVSITLTRDAAGRVVVRRIQSVDVLLRMSGVDEDLAWATDEGRRLDAQTCP